MSWFNEDKIEKVMVDWLNKEGFNKDPKKVEKIHGIDIQKRHSKRCRYWFIECKGFPSKNFKRKQGKKSIQTRLSQRYIWFISAIGQIALRMKQKNGMYGVAFPRKNYFEDKILDRNQEKTHLKIFRKRTQLHFFLVDRNRQIFQLTPNSNKFKKVS